MLSNRVVVVVGGSGGLGSAVSQYVAGKGAKVASLYCSNQDRSNQVVNAIQTAGGHATAIKVDITDNESVEAMAKNVVAEFGTIDVLINCAGVSRNSISWKMPKDDWEETLSINLTGAFNCVCAVLPTMRMQGWGRIINVTSIVGQIGVAGTAAYSATKAGLMGMTRTLAIEVASKGITVNSLALGYFDAGIITNVPPDKLEKIVALIPVGRLGKVEELCHVVDFLCADEAGYITGQIINLNGGLYLG